MNENGNSPGAPRMSTTTVIALAAIAALVGFAAVYGTLTRPDNTSVSAPQAVTPPKEANETRRRVPGLCRAAAH